MRAQFIGTWAALALLASMCGVSAQAPVKIGDDSKTAVEALHRLAEHIQNCPEMVTNETRWGKKPDEIKRTYEGPPHNVAWDVLPGNSVRAPYLGYVEFSLPMRYWVPETEQHKYNKTFGIGNTLDFENVLASAQSYRYEFDLGPNGLQPTRVLLRNKSKNEWIDANVDNSANYCWDAATRETPVISSPVPGPTESDAHRQIESATSSENIETANRYRKAADLGDAEAQFNLGAMYAAGEGVPKDEVEALRRYKNAAEQGNAHAQCYLGELHEEGFRVLQDYALAAAWYRKAAEQGDSEAQWRLGSLYEMGHGVAQDYTEAYFWLNVAAAGKIAGVKQEDIDTLRDDAASHLTPAVLSRVQERARKWFEDHSSMTH